MSKIILKIKWIVIAVLICFIDSILIELMIPEPNLRHSIILVLGFITGSYCYIKYDTENIV